MPSKRSSPIVAVTMLIVTGGIGLLAGVGVLSLIRGPVPPVAVADSPTPVATQPEPKSPGRKVRPQPVERERDPAPTRQRPADRPPAPAHPQQQLPNGIPPIAADPQPEPAREPAPPREPETIAIKPDLAKPSAIVPLTFEKSVIRVIAVPEKVPVNSLFCDIGLSENLLKNARTADVGNHSIVVEKLGHRGKFTADLPANIANCIVAIDIVVTHRNNAAICELKPRFVLPSGDVEQLTIARGSRLHKQLSNMLADAEEASRSISSMQSELATMERRANELQRMMSGQGSNPAETAAGRINAQAELTRLTGAIRRGHREVARAKQLIEDKPAIQKELAALEAIGKYAKDLASVATISVRFYSGDVTVPASASR